ncbi:ectonucleoside triphosphate diphosphohydrolase 4 isoform X1 [Tympanuchus pallidicinctus]|uniref:ectonucleoside triphosphate diphosphohydrolase 4 isoform X1 n=1 Tax=Tympanuchus pallidicinctus TaxID=109042 RepID=UPI002286D4F1|nr:ectonucleoside triphosphate diphosphohydrolase 4 isoform X1 [Tympanuchus pallidicinctus]XP_052557915.1 ectonucleoside triphosphate diphosphohydrolase 4 isoform X1 [Tympanuchus pallidicinctus]
MGRIGVSCLLPASWHFSISPMGCPRIFNTTLRQIVVIGILAAAVSLLYYSLVVIRNKYGRASRDKRFHRYLARVTDTEATDTNNPNLNYGIVVDCGSSGSRIFVYCWPRHNGNPHDLLDIKQMRDKNRKPVVMKIKPGISEFANTPEKVSDYIFPLLRFAAEHVPRAKHKETPLYILCTAGMRILPESQQKAILEDLVTDIPVHFDFLFSDSHAEVISGKQEGVYAWIGINFVLGRFEHTDDEDEAIVEVHIPGSENKEAIFRKRTVGILDMGGVSTQIAYEVPKTVSFASSQQEEVAKNLLAEFNLGCDAHQTEHIYRVYVATFLGFGGNAARQRYENSVFSSTVLKNGLLGRQTGMTSDSPYLDPCLPVDAQDEIHQNGQTMYLRGTGDFNLCRELIQPFMNKTNETQTSLNGVYQPAVHFQNSEFYGFSEFYYSTEDVLRMGGDYNAAKFIKAAKDYCATKWSVLRERFDRGLYASHADLHRLKYQCFKSAWVYEVFHSGFSFPASYSNLKTALQVYDKEVQWTLGAILYRTRFLPLRDIQQENFRGSHSHWRSFSFVYNHYLFFVCFLIVLLSILLYLLRLRRIHRRMLRNSSSPSLWMEEGLPPQKISAAL